MILADAAKAKTEAAKQATNASHVTADPVDANQALLGLTKATDGATKVLGAKATARDSQATGSGIRMAGARGNVTANTGMTTFTINAASMDTWTAVTGVANGVTHKFWVAARAVSEKADAWHTHYTANKAKITPGDNAFGFTAVGTNKKCDTSSIANGTWAAQSNVADLAACKTKCQEASRDAILVDPDTGAGATPASHNNGGGGTANNASKVMGKYTGAATYCAAYSFDNAGGAN